ncbi:MAG: hypothetical protein H8E14_04095 [Candidatus Marinimicrobia bacterium]|nr:hypothetical protein [Candidatus Neomarinimicrobiota bacterium]
MNTILDLNKLEQSAFRSKFNDGLLDITIGFLFFTFSQIPNLTDLGWGDFWSSTILLPAYLIAWLFYRRMKKYVITPRAGVFKYGQGRKQKLMRLNIFSLIILSISLILGIISLVKFSPGNWNVPVKFALVILIGFSLSGWYLNLKRLIVYGFLIALAFVVGELLFRQGLATHHGIPLALGGAASLIIMTGIILLLRFIAKHQPAGEEL